MRWPQRCRTLDAVRIADPQKTDGDRRRQHGRTVQVHVRATARTNGGASAPVTTPGTCSKPTNPSACGTQAKICFRGPGSVQRSRRWAGPLPVCCESGVRAARMPTHAGAAGAAFRPVVPHAPTRGDEEQNNRQALGPDQTRGDDVRLDFGRDANSSLDPHPEEACAAGRLEGRGP